MSNNSYPQTFEQTMTQPVLRHFLPPILLENLAAVVVLGRHRWIQKHLQFPKFQELMYFGILERRSCSLRECLYVVPLFLQDSNLKQTLKSNSHLFSLLFYTLSEKE